MGADPQLGIVRLGRHLDGNLGAVGQDATGTGIALIRGGDAQVVLTPEVPGWLVVQVACQQTVEIIERPDQGHHAGPRPLHRDGACRPQQGQHTVLHPQHHGDGRTARIHVLHADPGKGQ